MSEAGKDLPRFLDVTLVCGFLLILFVKTLPSTIESLLFGRRRSTSICFSFLLNFFVLPFYIFTFNGHGSTFHGKE